MYLLFVVHYPTYKKLKDLLRDRTIWKTSVNSNLNRSVNMIIFRPNLTTDFVNSGDVHKVKLPTFDLHFVFKNMYLSSCWKKKYWHAIYWCLKEIFQVLFVKASRTYASFLWNLCTDKTKCRKKKSSQFHLKRTLRQIHPFRDPVPIYILIEKYFKQYLGLKWFKWSLHFL